jgi:hypothetical protein
MPSPVFRPERRARAVGRVHRDRADGVLAEVLRHLEHEVVRALVDRGVRGAERLVDLG